MFMPLSVVLICSALALQMGQFMSKPRWFRLGGHDLVVLAAINP
jgi:hypothetical protein